MSEVFTILNVALQLGLLLCLLRRLVPACKMCVCVCVQDSCIFKKLNIDCGWYDKQLLLSHVVFLFQSESKILVEINKRIFF